MRRFAIGPIVTPHRQLLSDAPIKDNQSERPDLVGCRLQRNAASWDLAAFPMRAAERRLMSGAEIRSAAKLISSNTYVWPITGWSV